MKTNRCNVYPIKRVAGRLTLYLEVQKKGTTSSLSKWLDVLRYNRLKPLKYEFSQL